VSAGYRIDAHDKKASVDHTTPDFGADMTRLLSHQLAALTLLAACGTDPEPARKASTDNACGSDVGQECECDDGSRGELTCSDDELVCSCEDSPAAVSQPDAGKGGKAPAARDGSVRTLTPDAGTKPAPVIAEPDAGKDPVDADPVPTGGSNPVLPAISGECPELKTGTATIGGLSGISLQVGAKKEGTGSLIFYWHGTGSSAAEVNTMLPAGVRKEILDQGGIIVSPQTSTKKGADCSGTSTFSQGDFEVADLIAACAVKNHGINPRKIYTTGCSAGGLQAGCMATLRSSYIAAAVPNSGGITRPLGLQDPKHVPSIMTMHGGADDMVVVAFSQTSKTLDDQFKKAGGFVMNCDHGGGHCRAPAELQTAGWKFMQDHPFGVSPDPYTGGVPSSYPGYCMNK
jgi:predicted esterase